MVSLALAGSGISQTLLWDHSDVPNTSFVIRRTSTVTQHWTNWPVVTTVHHTNRWRISTRTNRCDLFTIQASNQFGLSAPPTGSVWRARSSSERIYTEAQVRSILTIRYQTSAPRVPPLPP